MEITWLVLLIIVPLVSAGVFAIARQSRDGTRQRRSALRRTGTDTTNESRQLLPRHIGPMSVVLTAAVIAAVFAALLIGFPLLRSLLIAFNAPVDAG